MPVERYIIILLLVICLHPLTANAQGCSDAGICTAPGFRQGAKDSTDITTNTLGFGLGYGLAQYQVHIINGYTEYSRNFGNHFNVGVKASFAMLAGPLALNTGLSDLYLITQYKSHSHFTPMLGIKLPFNRSDKKNGNRMLPMSYQTSLGTTDILAGISYTKSNLTITAGYQHPLTQNNNNFNLSSYTSEDIDQRYVTTTDFERKSDIMLRGYYLFDLKGRWSVLPGVLSIYHTSDDTYTDATGIRSKITGSEGLTLNLTALLNYQVNKTSTIQAMVGAPVISRKARPEGLSQISILLEYRAKF